MFKKTLEVFLQVWKAFLRRVVKGCHNHNFPVNKKCWGMLFGKKMFQFQWKATLEMYFNLFCYRFCNHHGKVECSQQKVIPEKLIWVAQILIPRLIICLYEKTKNKDEAMEEGMSNIYRFFSERSQWNRIKIETNAQKVKSGLN